MFVFSVEMGYEWDEKSAIVVLREHGVWQVIEMAYGMIGIRHKIVVASPLLVFLMVVVAFAQSSAQRQFDLDFDRLVLVERHELNPSHVYTYHNEDFKAGGGLYTYNITATGDGLTELVNAGQGQILDCDVSYDGSEILFSWKKSESEPYQLYSIGADGSGLKRLTEGPSYNFNGCWLPDGGLVFLSTRKPAFAYCWTSPVGVLHRMDGDGGNVRRISANYLNDFTPTVMNDGRIIYGRWEYVDRPAIPIQSLWTVNPDGRNVAVFYGNRVLSPATFIEARAIPGTGSILCTMTAHNGPCRGAIGIIDPHLGVNAQEAIRNLTPEVEIGLVGAGDGNRIRGPYESPYPIDGRCFLASRRGTIILRDYEGTKEVEILAPQDKMGFYSVQPIRPRPKPPVSASMAGGDDQQWATVFVHDVYAGLEPYVKRGQVKQIAVVQEIEKSNFADKKHRAFGFQFPVVSCGATYAPKKVWGYATVEDDGSAYFKVPARMPIYFMVLDEQGRAVQRMRSFTHLMGGEVRGCVGCHEPRHQTAAMNRRGKAMMRQAEDLAVPEWGLGGFSYAQVVQPVLDSHCVKCHNAINPPKGIDLTGDMTDFFNVSYETLARKGTVGMDPDEGGVDIASGDEGANPYTSWIATYNGAEHNILKVVPKTWGSPASRLADVVLSGHPDKTGKRRVELDRASRRRILAWIDLNVPYYGTSWSNHYERKGCRRLVPDKLEEVLQEVAQRKCMSCHSEEGKKEKVKLPRKFYVRITNPHLNDFLLAPLAKRAGGTGLCGEEVFESADDSDYQAILKTFEPIHELLADRPRLDIAQNVATMAELEQFVEKCRLERQ